jgi:hypothetical protein
VVSCLPHLYRHLTSRNSLLSLRLTLPVPAPSLDTRPAATGCSRRWRSRSRVSHPRHLSTRRARDEVHVAFLSTPLSRFSPPTTLLSAGNFPSLRFNNYQPSTGTLSASPFPRARAAAAALLASARCHFPSLLACFFTRRRPLRVVAWRLGSAWRPAASRAA